MRAGEPAPVPPARRARGRRGRPARRGGQQNPAGPLDQTEAAALERSPGQTALPVTESRPVCADAVPPPQRGPDLSGGRLCARGEPGWGDGPARVQTGAPCRLWAAPRTARAHAGERFSARAIKGVGGRWKYPNVLGTVVPAVVGRRCAHECAAVFARQIPRPRRRVSEPPRISKHGSVAGGHSFPSAI